MYETEHGPSGFDGPLGGDEINLIEPGVNYGWPIVSHEKTDPRFASPLDVFTPAEAPSGLLYYSGEALPQYTGSFLFGVLKGEGLIHVEFDEGNPREIVKLEKLELEVGRIREVVQGPDELIYFTTSNRDGRGTVLEGDDKIYRLRPE
jgi:glucose/arabinose dehydrogenase